MPFLQENGGPTAVGGEIGSGLPAARLVVDPDKMPALQRGFEDEAERIRDWLQTNRYRLSDVPPPGEDPCSKATVRALGENGQSALDAAWGCVEQLKQVAAALGEIARAYGVMEEDNTGKFRREPE